MTRTLSLVFVLFSALCITQGCSPNLGPLYRDYEVEPVDADIYDRILAALEVAGWDTTASSAPNVIKTKDRTLNQWLLYQTRASLEIIPIGDEYVRVLIHPWRHNFLRMKSKLPYLPSNIERKIVPELTDALEAQGLHVPGTMPEEESSVE